MRVSLASMQQRRLIMAPRPTCIIGNHTPIVLAGCGNGRLVVRNLCASSLISITFVTNAAAAHSGNAAQNIATNLATHASRHRVSDAHNRPAPEPRRQTGAQACTRNSPELDNQLQVLVQQCRCFGTTGLTNRAAQHKQAVVASRRQPESLLSWQLRSYHGGQ